MSKKLKTLCALVCAVCLLVPLAVPAAAADAEQDAPETEVITYMEIPLYENDEYIGTGLKIGTSTYVPLLAFCQSMLGTKCQVSWDSDTRTTTISAEGLDITLCTDDHYMLANGRYIYLPDGAYNINGTIVVPIRSIAKVFNVKVLWSFDDWSVSLITRKMRVPESGVSYYDETDLYWLSHVIYAESGNQSLEGMMGVGNVVLNRVNDDSGAFPDTIRDVIFQPGQFSVVDTGAIYMEPNELSVIAAKLCLEGYNTVEDSLFFLNPDISSDHWFKTNRTFVMSIDDHDFYA